MNMVLNEKKTKTCQSLYQMRTGAKEVCPAMNSDFKTGSKLPFIRGGDF